MSLPITIANFALNPFLSDVILQANGKSDLTFQAHKFLLASQSEVFHAIFSNNPSTERIVLASPIEASKRYPDFFTQSKLTSQNSRKLNASSNIAAGTPQKSDDSESTMISNVLRLAYMNVEESEKAQSFAESIISQENCFTYFALASLLGLKNVRQYFETYIVSHMNRSDDAMTLLLDGVRFQSEPMKQAALDSIVPNFESFLRSSHLFRDLINLPFDAFKSLIQRDDIAIASESDLFNVVYQYILKRESDPEEPSDADVPADLGEDNQDKVPAGPTQPVTPTPTETPVKVVEAPVAESEEPASSEPKGGEEAVDPPADAPAESADPPAEEPPASEEPPSDPPADAPSEHAVVDEPKGGLVGVSEVTEKGASENPESPPEEVKEPEEIAAESSTDARIYIMNNDCVESAQQRVQHFRLTSEKKKELLLSLRLGYVSHQELLKYSNIDEFSEFKDIFLEAISSKLNYFDAQDFIPKYKFILDPRQFYSEKVNNLTILGGGFDPLSRSQIDIQQENHKPEKKQQQPLSRQVSQHESHNPTPRKSVIQGAAVAAALVDSPHRPSQLSPIIAIEKPTKEQQQQQVQQFDNEEYLMRNSMPLHNLIQSLAALQMNGQILPDQSILHDGKPIDISLIQGNQGQYASTSSRVNSTHVNGGVNPYANLLRQPQQPRASTTLVNGGGLNVSALGRSMQSPASLEFVYKHDFDENGALYYLGTLGNTKTYQNPHVIGEVEAIASSIRAGKAEAFVGREVVNLSTCNEKLSSLGVDLGEGRLLWPTAYSIRNRNSSTYVLLNWVLEGSVDGNLFVPIDQRVHYDPNDARLNNTLEKQREGLKERGAISSYAIDTFSLKKTIAEHIPQTNNKGFRYFRIVQISKNSHGSENLSLSGFELYGKATGPHWAF